jgi:hypothetical protein
VQLRWGPYWFQVASCEWTHEKQTLISPGGVPYEEQNVVDVFAQLVIDGGQATIANTMSVFERALRVPGLDLVLHRDDGGVALALSAASSTGGTNVRRFSYPQGGGGFEWVSGRTFRFQVTASYPLVVGARVLLAFKERVSAEGNGGPRPGAVVPVNAPAVIQTLTQFTECYCTQSGFAVGLAAYPTPPAPLFRQAPLSVQVGYDSAEAEGLSRRAWRVDWTYRWVGNKPFLGALPNQWPRGQ